MYRREPRSHWDRKCPVKHHRTCVHESQLFGRMSKETTFSEWQVGQLTYNGESVKYNTSAMPINTEK